ncbi:inactive pancreatic lipase-related protein 1-like [Clavelina lepadiformis]
MDRKFLLVLCVFILGETNADEICYDELGCFSDGWPFVSVQRPIPYLPWSPGNISTAFWLYTRRNKYFSQELNYNDEESITQSNFKAIKDTKFIVHGFISEGSTR